MIKAQEQDDNFNWTEIAAKVNHLRTGKQCRERWQNHLRADIKKGNWSVKEEQMIESMFQAFGPK
jgi:transcription factor MYB, plant